MPSRHDDPRLLEQALFDRDLERHLRRGELAPADLRAMMRRGLARRMGGFGRRGERGKKRPKKKVGFDPDTLPLAIGISTSGLTLADSDTTVQTWTAAHGALAGLALAAPAATNRPAYSATGGAGSRPIVTFDGINDVLTAALTKGSAWATFEIGVVGRSLGATDNRYAIAYDNTTGFRMTYWDTVNNVRLETRGTGGVTSISTSDPGAARAHVSGDWDGATQRVRFAGVVEDSDAAAPSAYSDGLAVSLGAAPTAAAPLQIEVQAWYIGARLTDEQRTNLRAWLTTNTGISS